MSRLRTSQVELIPDFIDLGIGQPGFDLLPARLLRWAASQRLDGEDSSFLNYGIEQGDGNLRRELARFLATEYDQPVPAEQLFITTGASTALSMICTLFTRPGDVVFVEEPSYFLALRIFADHDLRVVGIPVDEEGLDLDALADRLVEATPVFLYTIPTFQNPTGITMSEARRNRLVVLAEAYGFLIVADEVYHALGYGAAPAAPLAGRSAGGRVLSVGSFSKILAPGLRLGWIQAAQPMIERFVNCGLVDSGGGLNPFTSALVWPLLAAGEQSRYLQELRAVYGARIQTLDRALARELGERVSYRRPDGGFFFWLRLPESVSSTELLAAARAQRVGFQPGVRFSSYGGLDNHLRLSFAFYGVADLEEGVRRLGSVLRTL